ncbi:MAG: leucine--tRNA ligase, partial [Candidatus Competibacterales bacterium]
MDPVYRPSDVEQSAQRHWETHAVFQVDEDPSREKFYCLCMFPYPSGKLHMGHVRNYTIGDVVARYQRMLGKNVLQPMGWDAFGLPAEGAAIKNNLHPAAWTYQNIAYMKGQLQRLGYGYDWRRELATCRPDYYRWEQWLFTRLLAKGLAYKKNAVVNWDPVDQTVLANEQVIDGRGWRSGALVERREIPQWFLRITAYAQELLDDLDHLDWPESVKTMQRNWIGRSEGVEADFALADPVPGADVTVLRIYTTRPDTIMGVTYMAVAAEHPLALAVATRNPEIQAFVDDCRQGAVDEASIETAEKRGVPLGVEAIHPLSGERIPVWSANFVLMGYGTGAVMAVPGHDQRDFEFARKYGLPIRQVVAPKPGGDGFCDLEVEAFVTKDGVVVNSGPYDGLDFPRAFDAIAKDLEAKGCGERRVNFRLRDWLVSRQRYWGAPIPVINTQRGPVATPDGELPVVLPEDVALTASGSPWKQLPSFIAATDPETGEPATRETDTFDTFMESSWYYARFCCPDNDTAMLDHRAHYWLPVDLYIGGIEHAILHLLYARFYHKLLRDLGLAKGDEPFKRLLTQGMVEAQTFYRHDEAGHLTHYNARDVEVERDERGRVISAVLLADGSPVTVGGVEKMSKSKNNGVDPQELIERFGADTVRLYTMFTAPPDQSLEWNDSAVQGSHRFLQRVWSYAVDHGEGLVAAAGPAPQASAKAAFADARFAIHDALRQALADFERHQYNTVVSGAMKIFNALGDVQGDGVDAKAVRYEGFSILLRLRCPNVPHICLVLWRALAFRPAILEAPGPQEAEAA